MFSGNSLVLFQLLLLFKYSQIQWPFSLIALNQEIERQLSQGLLLVSRGWMVFGALIGVDPISTNTLQRIL